MKLIVLAVILVLFAVSAHAQNMVSRDGDGNVVTLMTAKCTISPWTTEWLTASFLYHGRVFAACWRLQGKTVVIFDSGGDITPLPMSIFKPEVKA